MTALERPRAGALAFTLMSGVLAVEPVLSQETVTEEHAGASEAAAALVDGDMAATMAAGEKEYLANCRTCHGSKGTAGVPLAGNEKVMHDFGYLTWAIVTGPGYMPEFAEVLSDEQIAQISTYILNSWGNSFGLVTAEDVAAVR